MSGETLLVLEDVACRRGGRLLFEGLNLRLQAGGAAVVSGPNGAGKSSLLRLVVGLLGAAAGRIERAGAALADDRAALDERLTLERALAFWARLDGVEVGPAMAAMGLTELARAPVRMLSTGQRKRAMLARVLAGPARLWLLDEPLNGLDADGQARLARAIAAHRAAGGALLAATHQPLGLEQAAEVTLG